MKPGWPQQAWLEVAHHGVVQVRGGSSSEAAALCTERRLSRSLTHAMFRSKNRAASTRQSGRAPLSRDSCGLRASLACTWCGCGRNGHCRRCCASALALKPCMRSPCPSAHMAFRRANSAAAPRCSPSANCCSGLGAGLRGSSSRDQAPWPPCLASYLCASLVLAARCLCEPAGRRSRCVSLSCCSMSHRPAACERDRGNFWERPPHCWLWNDGQRSPAVIEDGSCVHSHESKC